MTTERRSMMLACKGLEVGYGGRALLPPLGLEIGRGEFWAVLGRNGAGKTTLFKTLLGLLSPVRGTVRTNPSNLRFAYVAQRSAFDDLVPMLAREVVRQGCERSWSFLRPRLREPAIVEEALREVDALDLASKPFRALSEGQKQRVLLARLIAAEADLALLDEPTAAMDVVAEKEAFERLDELRKRRDVTIVVVSHYLGVAHHFADRAVFLDAEAGAAVVGSPDEVIEHAAFKRRYSSYGLEGDCHE